MRVRHLICPNRSAQPVDWRDAEEIEAEVRVLMARHSAIVARGFDSSKKRAGLHRTIDGLLDDLSMFQEVTPREL